MLGGLRRAARLRDARERAAVAAGSMLILILPSILFTPPRIASAAQAQASTQTTRQGEQNSGQQPSGENRQGAAGPTLRLEDFERLALQNNPTLRQAEAAVRAAEGRRVQAGLMPNPTVGYFGEEISTRAPGSLSEHGVFFEQEFPLGGKLSKSRRVFAEEKTQAEAEAAAQRQRVLNTVRALYYEALGAQQLVDVRTELARIAREAVGISGELFNVGQADRPDVLAGEIEAELAQLDLVTAENRRDQVWQQLAAVVGDPFLKPVRLAGTLERGLPILDEQTTLATLLSDSPEVKRARAGVARANAAITRAEAGRAPDLFVRGGFGYNREFFDAPPSIAGRRVGPEAQVEVGLRIPLWNRNQGGIAAAGAEAEIAEREARRVELVLRARMATAFRTYQNALSVVNRYERQIIPRAQRAYDLYLTRFRQMAASYPQALIAQRTLFQARADYVAALVDVWRSAVQIQGFLLTGGLDAPAGLGLEGGGEAGEGVGGGAQGAGLRDGGAENEQ
jgi:outer membrane protein, heavy metal efflux system